jgi:hypothetical protein
MRDNFRPNVRLTTNILMVIGTFLIAFNLAPIAKNAKLESLCFEYLEKDNAASLAKTLNFKNQKDYNKSLLKVQKKIAVLIGVPPVIMSTNKKVFNSVSAMEYCKRRIYKPEGF